MKRALALLAVVATVLTGCTRQNLKEDELSDALYKTETMPRTFTHEERYPPIATTEGQKPGGLIVIEGVIEDDYRFRLDGSTDGKRFASEVVVDDARALRLNFPADLGDANDAQRALVRQAALHQSLEIRAAFEDGHWVVDPKGANKLFAQAQPSLVGQKGGESAYLNQSLEVLKYVRRAMGEAAAVQLFNPESPEYRPRFDPFPAPGARVRRYDLVPPALTPRDPTTAAGAAQQLPGVRFFRRMAVYVRDGIVEEIRERISVEDMLKDPVSRLAARIGDYDITLPDASVREQADFLVGTINATARRLSQPEILPRDLRVTFTDLGRRKVVKLPADAARGSLAGIRDDGQVLFETPG